MPPKSPDLMPVKRSWVWLQKKLRRMDLADAVAKRPAMSKDECKTRARRVVRTKQAHDVASNRPRLMKKVCRAVLKKKGAATGSTLSRSQPELVPA